MPSGEDRYLDIEITGIVQGVGFRPFAYRLARELGIRGHVTNTERGVRIKAAASGEALGSLLDALRREAPRAAVVEEVRQRDTAPFEAEGFAILESTREGESETLVSPDLATCPECLQELLDPADRRYRYPFINCTNCGPRFTIIRETPYDRPMTTMAAFEMCALCSSEYHDPANRRFHAQPNACPDCGPRLWLEDARGRELHGDPVREAAAVLREGGIVSLKGLGGFQLACDATSERAVERMRERKHRYAKPLAVMVRDLREAGNCCELSAEEARLLASPRAPIVLLGEREDSPLSASVAPGLVRQGVFLPYTPLHHLLLREAGVPLVMTSGNLSEEPIARDNAEALERLGNIADRFLLHDRDILMRYDDSVAGVLEGVEFAVRRARGYAPYPVTLGRSHTVQVLALGPELKNTFCFLRGAQAFVGQHIGDLDDRETLLHFKEAMEAVRRLFSLQPEVVAHDLHPDYLTTSIAAELDLPLEGVQHHHAHVASCIAENGLEGEVIGVAWDGTGYGEDGTVWGGEFLVCGDGGSCERRAHLSTYRMPGGDACVMRPGRMALAVLWEVLGEEEALEAFVRWFEPEDMEVEALAFLMRTGVNTPLTSSAGRSFDAAAALVGLRDIALYDGQAACELEAAAADVREGYGCVLDTTAEPWRVDTRPLFLALLEDMEKRERVEEMAGRFHLGLARAAVDTCARLSEETGLERVALSGGVFQNRRLTVLVKRGLERIGMKCYLHRRVPCNDGGVSLGQAVVAARRLGGALPAKELEISRLAEGAMCAGGGEGGSHVPGRAG